MLSEALQAELVKSADEKKDKAIKVVVWDLDNTIWDGVLLEDESVRLRPGIVDVIRELDRRGILQSISSKNDQASAMAMLESLGIDDYFIYPQINWNAKSQAIKSIASSINVGIDTLAFVDDQAFEREEVAFEHEQVLCLNVDDIPDMLARPEFNPRFITEDSRNRRQMYLSDIRRNSLEHEFKGPKDEFLATLGLELTLFKATEEDLKRAEELTRRTHQLNTTGYTYSYDELKDLMKSPDHELIIAGLVDKFGTYGKIGLCLIERSPTFWTLKLLLMSCRVMSRGVGTILIGHIINEARAAGVTLRAEFIRTSLNRMMFVTYRLGGFKLLSESGDMALLEHDCAAKQEFPSYITVNIDR